MPQLLETLRGPGALRLMLALVVVVHHVSRIALGTAAVYVFFVLSGFWIWRMWESKYSRARAPYATFIVSRVWRLLPVFLFVSSVTLAGEMLVRSGLSEFLQVASTWQLNYLAFSSVLILGYSGLSFIPIGPAWSLDIELQFYLLAPLFVALLARQPRAVMVGGVALSLLFLGTSLNRSLPVYLIFFLLGMRICQLGWQPTHRTVTITLGGAFILAVVTAAVPVLQPLLMGGATPSPLHEEWSPIFNLVMAMLVVPYAVATTTRAGGRHDGFYADMAYVVYLLHWVMAVMLADYVGNLSTANRLAVTVLWFIVMLAASYLVWRFVDQPFNRLRGRFVRDRIQASPTRRAGIPEGAPRV